ncbi:MAG: hypothetical protein ACP5FH_10860 [Terracidiphilus sp.]
MENADVTIRYRQISPRKSAWTTFPVVRMHVAGKGLETTHYGNNLHLNPGGYVVRVTVDGGSPVVFRFFLVS